VLFVALLVVVLSLFLIIRLNSVFYCTLLLNLQFGSICLKIRLLCKTDIKRWDIYQVMNLQSPISLAAFMTRAKLLVAKITSFLNNTIYYFFIENYLELVGLFQLKNKIDTMNFKMPSFFADKLDYLVHRIYCNS